MSRATFEGILRDAGVTEGEMGRMREARERAEEGRGDEKEEGEKEEDKDEEVSNNSAQDRDSEGRACSPKDNEDGRRKWPWETYVEGVWIEHCDGGGAWYFEGQNKGYEYDEHGDQKHPWDFENGNTVPCFEGRSKEKAVPNTKAADKEAQSLTSEQHSTQVIHYICGCSHTVFFNDDDDDKSQPKVPEHSHAGVMCARCLERQKLWRVASTEIEELQKAVDEMAIEKGFEKKLRAGNLKISLQFNHDRRDEPEPEEAVKDGLLAPPRSPVSEPIKFSEEAGKENNF